MEIPTRPLVLTFIMGVLWFVLSDTLEPAYGGATCALFGYLATLGSSIFLNAKITAQIIDRLERRKAVKKLLASL